MSKAKQSSLASAKVGFHDETIRKILGRCDTHGRPEVKTATDQKDHKGQSNIVQKKK